MFVLTGPHTAVYQSRSLQNPRRRKIYSSTWTGNRYKQSKCISMFESESGVGTRWTKVALIGFILHLLCLHILIWKFPKMVPKLSSVISKCSVRPKGWSRFPWMKLLVLLHMYAELFTKSLQILIRSLPVCGEATLQMEALFKKISVLPSVRVPYSTWTNQVW